MQPKCSQSAAQVWLKYSPSAAQKWPKFEIVNVTNYQGYNILPAMTKVKTPKVKTPQYQRAKDPKMSAGQECNNTHPMG